MQPDQVDEVIMGNVLSAGLGMNPARQAAIAAGIPDHVPATSINKVCGSGLKAVALATQAIILGDADIVLAGGMEGMSSAPYLLPKARYGYKMGHGEVVDHMIKDGLWCALTDCHMGNTAENIALEREISRGDQDEFSVQSQQKAAAAWDNGRFADEIVPVEVKQRKGTVTVDKDEHFRPDTSIEGLSKLRPAFAGDGSVTAGNASGINDGAAAVVVMSRKKAEELGVKPMGSRPLLRQRRRPAAHHGHRPGAGDAEGARRSPASRSTRSTSSRPTRRSPRSRSPSAASSAGTGSASTSTAARSPSATRSAPAARASW